MPLTAFSKSGKKEVDIGQWLTINGFHTQGDLQLMELPSQMREWASLDIACSCCDAMGVTLVRTARGKSTGQPVAQGHFRFRAADGTSLHERFCDFYDESNVRGTDYLTNFNEPRTELTRKIRDLVCRGITAGLFSQEDMHNMRKWFLKEKEANTRPMDVTPELLDWCEELQKVYRDYQSEAVNFMPAHGLIPTFDWEAAATKEWALRNEVLLTKDWRSWVHFHGAELKRARVLAEKHAGDVALDPTTLLDKYRNATLLATFAVVNVFGHKHTSRDTHALLAFSALLLFKCDWDPQRASALFSRLMPLPPLPEGIQGNLIGLNPFHDYEAWRVINAARLKASNQTDARPIAIQIAEIKTQIQTQFQHWNEKRAHGQP
ncbi:MAG: hypothetical protein V4858_09365 [Pseudomonadota bacterium]